jgi:cytosine/adenosine deaminase-related metal-dependent hydrolase
MSLDPFISIRSELRIQRYSFQDPSIISPGKLLKMITIDAARALGMDNMVGSVENGKIADIILVDMFKPHLTPSRIIPQMLVHYASGQDVSTVIVEGKVLMKDRDVLSIDVDNLLTDVNKSINSSFQRLEKLGYRIGKYTDISNDFWDL